MWEGFLPQPPDSELVKTVKLIFCSFQQLFDRDIHVKFGISNSLHSIDIRQKPDLGISSFQKFGQIAYKQIVITLDPVIRLTRNLD